MRATQKKRMSCPVSSSVVGCHAARSALDSSGQPSVEKGKRPDENHVSSTSSSCVSVSEPGAQPYSASAAARASSSELATCTPAGWPSTLAK